MYADMHERNVLGLCATVKKEDRYAFPNMAQEIPSVVSRLTASLAYSTPCWIFFIRSSADEVCSCLSTIDKFRKDALFLSYKKTNKKQIKKYMFT